MNILITGATGQIGQFLLPQLVQQGHHCLAISRKAHPNTLSIEWQQADLTDKHMSLSPHRPVHTWIHLAFLNLACPHLPTLAQLGVKRFIGFSSTSIFTKQNSGSPQEKQIITRLIAAEAQLQTACRRLGIEETLFRPTLIYGAGCDKNITVIQKFIQKFGFFPLAGKAQGLRQPVHAQDLAKACLAVLNAPQTYRQTYQLAGAETLSYQSMVKRLFKVQNRPCRLLHLPPALYKTALYLLSHSLPRYAYIQPAMADRMNQDMVFDIAPAQHAFAYQPKPFQPPPLSPGR